MKTRIDIFVLGPCQKEDQVKMEMLVQGIRFHISIVHDMASVGFPYKKAVHRSADRETMREHTNPPFLIFVVLRSVRKWQEAGM